MKTIKSMLVLVMLVFVSYILVGCGGYELPEGMDEAEVTATGEQIVGLINAGDYESVIGMLREDLRDLMTAEEIEAALAPVLGEMGEFQSIKATATAGTEDEETGEQYGVAVIVGQYENGTVQYYFNFDKDMWLVGIFAK